MATKRKPTKSPVTLDAEEQADLEKLLLDPDVEAWIADVHRSYGNGLLNQNPLQTVRDVKGLYFLRLAYTALAQRTPDTDIPETE